MSTRFLAVAVSAMKRSELWKDSSPKVSMPTVLRHHFKNVNFSIVVLQACGVGDCCMTGKRPVPVTAVMKKM